MQRRLHALAAGALAATALLGVRPALAGDAAAEVLFLEGRKAAERGDHQTACAKFHESNRIEFAVGTVFNIGDCEEKLGRVATAWRSFREVVQRLPPGDERIAIAQQRADVLEKRLPRLTLRLASGAPGATRVVRGGVEMGSASLGVALPVDPGEQTIEVSASGRKAATFQVRLAEGEQRELEVQPGEALSSSRRTAGLVVGGVGVAGLLVGGVTGALTLGKKSTADANCPDKRCNREGFDAVDSGRLLGNVSVVGFVVGALGAGAGAYLLLTEKNPDQARTSLLPSVGPGSFQFSWARTW
jgi:hypothetical protein